MSIDAQLQAANARLLSVFKSATLTKWPGGRYIAIVQEPGIPAPFRFVAETPDECVDAAFRWFNVP